MLAKTFLSTGCPTIFITSLMISGKIHSLLAMMTSPGNSELEVVKAGSS